MSNTTPFDFSLILCTINRTVEVREFLTSLAAQKRKFNIELVVVDQNPDQRLFPVLQEFQNLFTITGYKGSNPAGFSFASSAGDQATGVDTGTYPTPRIYTFGVRMNF